MHPRSPRWTGYLALIGACFACGAEPAGEPAGAGGSGGTAATTSATHGASASAASSGGGELGWPGWSPLSGVAPECDAFSADKPDALPPLSWVPCADGSTGCRELEITWAPASAEKVMYSDIVVGPFGGAVAVVLRRKLAGELTGWSEMVMAHVDGSVLGAVRSRDPELEEEPCIVSRAGVGSNRIAFGVFESAKPKPSEYDVLLLPGGSPAAYAFLSEEVVHGNRSIVRVPAEAFVATLFSPGYIIMNVPYDGSPPTLVAEFSQEDPKKPGDPLVWQRRPLLGDPRRPRARAHLPRRHGRDRAAARHPRPRAQPRTARRSSGCSTRRRTRCPTGRPRFELWSSPFAASASGLAPKKLADVSPTIATPYVHLADGMYVIRGTVGVGADTS